MLTEHDTIKKQTMKRNSKKIQCGIIAAIIAVALAIVGLIVCFSGFGNERQVHLYVDQDDDADSILQKLQAQCSPQPPCIPRQCCCVWDRQKGTDGTLHHFRQSFRHETSSPHTQS